MKNSNLNFLFFLFQRKLISISYNTSWKVSPHSIPPNSLYLPSPFITSLLPYPPNFVFSLFIFLLTLNKSIYSWIVWPSSGVQLTYQGLHCCRKRILPFSLAINCQNPLLLLDFMPTPAPPCSKVVWVEVMCHAYVHTITSGLS